MCSLSLALGAASADAAVVVPGVVPCHAGNCVKYPQFMFYSGTGTTLVFMTGDSNLGVPTDYTLEVLKFPPKEGGLPIATVTRHTPTDVLEYPVTFTKAGLYYIRAKACQGLNADGTPNCSRWAVSYDPIDTQPSNPFGFFVFIYLSGATNGGVN